MCGQDRARVTSPMSSYLQEWQNCKTLTNQFILAFVVQISIVIACIYFGAAARRNLEIWLALELCWAAIFVLTAIRLQRFECPRCGKRYFVGPRYHNVFARHCLNCGLQKYSD
jgi:DNA-directed RNA polymerase subunit RPC12/RpoP